MLIEGEEAPSATIVEGQPKIFAGLAKKSTNSSLVYNMQPTPGTPAEFGFVAAGGVPFVLEAKLRSDGDYGITVGDNAVADKALAAQVTLCENGATEVKKVEVGQTVRSPRAA